MVWNLFAAERLAGALLPAGVSGPGLAGSEYRFFTSRLPRLVREGVKNSDDGAVGG